MKTLLQYFIKHSMKLRQYHKGQPKPIGSKRYKAMYKAFAITHGKRASYYKIPKHFKQRRIRTIDERG